LFFNASGGVTERIPSSEAVGVGEARLFVALDLPDAVRGALARWAAQMAAADDSLRAIKAEQMHVTLCFLGNRPVSEIDAIGAVCAETVRPPVFELATGGAVGFPAERPRVLAAAIEDRSRGLYKLQARLAIALAELGAYRPERRPFTPHVTLARVDARAGRDHGGAHGRAASGRTGQRLLAPVPFTASTVTLFSSRTLPSGSVYEPLRSVFLDVPS
jgi:2'-5' RNA ligase